MSFTPFRQVAEEVESQLQKYKAAVDDINAKAAAGGHQVTAPGASGCRGGVWWGEEPCGSPVQCDSSVLLMSSGLSKQMRSTHPASTAAGLPAASPRARPRAPLLLWLRERA
jgi:hypothetical protein